MQTLAEAESRALYERAGFTLNDTPGMFMLVRCILGAAAIVTHTGLTTPGRFLPKQRQIWLREGLSAVQAEFVLAHELAEFALHELGYQEPDKDQQCDAIAARLVCPRTAFQRAIRAVGDDLPQLANGFLTTQSVAALRLGETTGRPVVLITERHVHARGDAFEWGTVTQIRRAARVGVPGLERRDLTDAPRRVVLLAAA
jgi:hypothetical protein